VIPDAYFERFSTPKYRAKNPIQRRLIKRFAATLHGLFLDAGPTTRVLEIGVGEGFLSGYLSEKLADKSFTGLDVREEDLERLRRLFPRIEAKQGSIYDLGAFAPGSFDLVLCCEVLEHLDEPARALGEIHRLAPRHAIFSVPHEPWFLLSNLARGKNLRTFGNDPEHVQHYGVRTFRRLLEARFAIETLTTSYPWILALTSSR
jgi:SAM-dependent methyltransferase